MQLYEEIEIIDLKELSKSKIINDHLLIVYEIIQHFQIFWAESVTILQNYTILSHQKHNNNIRNNKISVNFRCHNTKMSDMNSR